MSEKKDPKEEESKDKKETVLDRAYNTLMGNKASDDKKKGE